MKKQYSVSIDPEYQYDMPAYASSVVELQSNTTKIDNAPYIETEVVLKAVFKEYNPDFGDGKLCKCGHSYYRHFDSYENMAPVGCKYCECDEFVLAEDAND